MKGNSMAYAFQLLFDLTYIKFIALKLIHFEYETNSNAYINVRHRSGNRGYLVRNVQQNENIYVRKTAISPFCIRAFG